LVVRRSWKGNDGELCGGFERKQTGGMMSLQILKWNTVTSKGWCGILPSQFLELDGSLEGRSVISFASTAVVEN
jgi:hypothetical protein